MSSRIVVASAPDRDRLVAEIYYAKIALRDFLNDLIIHLNEPAFVTLCGDEAARNLLSNHIK
jgi:hypothetical protein